VDPRLEPAVLRQPLLGDVERIKYCIGSTGRRTPNQGGKRCECQ
jgi:hypothetical protein